MRLSLFFCITLGLSLLFSCAFDTPATESTHSLFIDQLGYRTLDPKVAVIANPTPPAEGEPFNIPTFQVKSAASQQVVYSGSAQLWNDGALHPQSGDRALWFDFSPVTTPGSYVIRNSTTGETSAPFEIDDSVYRQALITATRMFFYQRSGFAKQPPYADPRWTDDAAFLGPNQDTEAHFVNDKTNEALVRDLRGGWFDAGDTNKYVTFAIQAVHQLLDAYSQNPHIWTDDFNLPESGNGIPDLIDELRFELEWLRRMQDDDGGSFIKLGTLDFNAARKPSLDRRPRFYGPKCSSSTISTASMFAHAAFVFQSMDPLREEAADLQRRALDAWSWFLTHPIQTECDSQEIKSGDADRAASEQIGTAVTAAIYLSALTDAPQFNAYISEHFRETRPFRDIAWSIYEVHVGDALLAYTQMEHADEAVKAEILRAFAERLNTADSLYRLQPELDPYRAYMPDDQYHWGSNAVKGNLGNTIYDAARYSSDFELKDDYQNHALDFIHYMHGVNPLGLVYLTNMYEIGAEHSANEMYHEWFGGGIYDNALSSPSGPAPGYVTGGPNKNYTGSAPLASQPPQRAYLDQNDGGDLNMWEITEPGIYYQSAYLKLLSRFCSESSAR